VSVEFVARYDLSRRNVSFDFYAWQTHAWILGAREIVFDVSRGFGRHDEPEARLRQRYETVVRPGPSLLGLPWREGTDGVDCAATHKYYGIMDTGVVDFPRLRSTLPPRDVRYTVTLRNAKKHPHRNSNRRLWVEFARVVGARVIEDYDDRSISLEERMALYAGARMNFGVSNGPMGLLLLSSYPVVVWGCENAEFAWSKHGVPRGGQPLWLLPEQSLRWRTPKLSDLTEFVEKFERTGEC